MATNQISDSELVPARDAAEQLGVLRTKLGQLERDGALLTVKRGGASYVPAALLVPLDAAGLAAAASVAALDEDELPAATHKTLEHLPGTVTLLRDAGYSTKEIVHWLWQYQEELGEAPIDAIRAAKHHHVNRVASTLGF